MTDPNGSRTPGSDGASEDEAASVVRRDTARANADGWTVTSYLLSGPIVWGGAGWGLDAWLGTGFFLPVGIIGGMGAALYLVWVRYGTS